jgi:hypothetical protein
MSVIYPTTRTKRHYLFEIDQDKKTAYCSACGWTKIHLYKTRTTQKPKVVCVKRYRESHKANKIWVSIKRPQKSNPQSKHVLSEIDVDKLRGVCSICGRTDLERRTYKTSTYYYCATNIRAKARKATPIKRSASISNSTAHKLSQIDIEHKLAVCSVCGLVEIYIWRGARKIAMCCSNAKVQKGSSAENIRREINIQLINDYKVKNGCINCGYKKHPFKLYLCSPYTKIEEHYIARLLRLTKKDLISNLDNCQVHCVNCQ